MLGDDEDNEAFSGSISDPTEGLSPDIPSASTPSTADAAEADVSGDLLVTFWGLVVTLNLALFATSLGLMLAYFRGQLQLGGGLFALGVVAFAYSYYKYRRYLDRDNEDDENDDGSAKRNENSGNGEGDNGSSGDKENGDADHN